MDVDRKRKNHTLTEKTRRQKLSQKIKDLKDVLHLPDCISIKHNVLAAAVQKIDEIQKRQAEINQKIRGLQDHCFALQLENERLKLERHQPYFSPYEHVHVPQFNYSYPQDVLCSKHLQSFVGQQFSHQSSLPTYEPSFELPSVTSHKAPLLSSKVLEQFESLIGPLSSPDSQSDDSLI